MFFTPSCLNVTSSTSAENAATPVRLLPAGIEPAVIPLPVKAVSKPVYSVLILMPDEPQGYRKGRDNDCL